MPRIRPLRRLRALFTWHRRDRDMDDEMRHHIELLASEYIRSGMSRSEAEAAARRRFGNVRRLKQQGHDARTSRVLEDLIRDVRHMGRSLRRSPAFALTVILTLGLGIGGNTAIFSVVDQVLLRPLPYPHGDRLLTIAERSSRPGSGTSLGPIRRNGVSPANWLDWQRDNHTLENIAAWSSAPATLTGVGEPARLNAQTVSAEFFPILGVKPLLGRTITDADDRPNAPRVVVLSYHLWQQRFSGDRQVIGRVVQVNGRPAEIVGVMPAQFQFIYQDNDLWAPIQLDRHRPWRDTAGRFLNTVARLKPGVPLDDARKDLEAVAQRLAASYEFNKNTSVTLVPVRDELTGEVQTSLFVLYAAVAVLLSIACFNVANLLLARATTRGRELAVRTALGASRGAIVRQLLIEGLLLSIAGGVLGIVLARWSLQALMAFAPPDLLRVPELTVDTRVLLYALGVSMLTGIAVGLVPAVLIAGRSIVDSIKVGGLTTMQAPRVRQALVVCQVALTVVLLCGAGLLVRTVVALNHVDDGFNRHDVLTMEVTMPPAALANERRARFYSDVVATLAALPSVESAAAANSLPVIGTPRGGTSFHRLGTPQPPIEQRPSATIRVVSPGFFRTLGIPVIKGREFTEADSGNPSFIVNDAFVKAYLDGVDPLTTRLSVQMLDTNPYLPIVGVVGDVSEGAVRNSARPTVYYSHAVMPQLAMTMFVRTPQPDAVGRAAESAIHRLNGNVPVTRIRTLETALAESVARERLNAIVSGGFALSGLAVAALGIYGLLTFIVAQRTKEIAIRMALGARVGRVTQSVVGNGLRLVAVGAAIGVLASLSVLGALETLLYDVTPYDLPTYASVLAMLLTIAAVASYVPARYAARIEPLKVLRQE